MSKVNKDSLAVSIDIGTTKICVLVAHKKADNTIEVLAVGKSPSHGLKKGIVVDIAKTVQSIKNAVHEAEFIAGITIDRASVGISGSHIHSYNSLGASPIKKGYVKHQDIVNVLTSARAIALPEGQQILHVLPKYYTIDGNEKTLDPLGMAGIRLEAQVHIISGAIASVQNIIRCCQMAGVEAEDLILEQLASADAVLSKDERELGVGVLDIGGGTADFAIYQHGSIRHTKVLPIAGNHFTHDLAIGLQTTIAEAQRIKEEFGITHHSFVNNDLDITLQRVDGTGQQHIKHKELLKILFPRTEEILTMLKKEITEQHLQSMMTTGLVLTGGGSLLAGVDILAQEMLNVPVRVGKPHTGHILPESLNSPIYATGYGLVVHSIEKKKNGMGYLEGPLVTKILIKMKSWVSDFF
ncbi:cell division protein FtsA [candidate division TM6 bacterium RIFCSPHIGHO2_12_FULL_36_22]|nr:MAG: cell division protein FtsA [candidate division TM6 bacterium RIFCSPHIGHO2_12_FULL_36_22]